MLAMPHSATPQAFNVSPLQRTLPPHVLTLAHAAFSRFDAVLLQYGFGPFLDGMFTQSALGIVTKMYVAHLSCPRSPP